MSWMRHDSTKSNQQFNVLHDLFPSAAQALQILEVSILEELFGVTVLEQTKENTGSAIALEIQSQKPPGDTTAL